MTPKEKAEDLRSSFSDVLFDEIEGYYQKNHIIKLCALIAVDEIIKAKTKILDKGDGWQLVESNIYWQEVKLELNKL